MKELPQAFLPQPVLGRPRADLRTYIEGRDAVSGRPFVDELLDGLTVELEQAATVDRSTPRLLEADTPENFHRVFVENLWTDFLPIVLPAKERVDAMLA